MVILVCYTCGWKELHTYVVRVVTTYVVEIFITYVVKFCYKCGIYYICGTTLLHVGAWYICGICYICGCNKVHITLEKYFSRVFQGHEMFFSRFFQGGAQCACREVEVHEAWREHCALPVIVLCRHFTLYLLHHLCFPGFSRYSKEIPGVFHDILCENIFPGFLRVVWSL